MKQVELLCTIPTPGAISDFSQLHVGKYGVWTVSLETGTCKPSLWRTAGDDMVGTSTWTRIRIVPRASYRPNYPPQTLLQPSTILST